MICGGEEILGSYVGREGCTINWFDRNGDWSIGKGNKFSFWSDKFGSDTLKNMYARVYLNSVKKEGNVEQFGTWSHNKWQWEFEWRI